MCRLSLMNKEGFKELENKITGGVVAFLDYLEKMCGGDGNGYFFVKDGKLTEINKGKKLSNKVIYKKCLEADYDWFAYHTRITSQGKTCDSQCHPFVTQEKDFALMMNGTEREYGAIGRLIGSSDTDAIFRVFHALNIEESNLKDMSSRFIGFRKKENEDKGYVFFTNSSTNGLHLMKTSNKNAIVVASSFPVDVPSKEIENRYYWKEGSRIKIKKIEKKPSYVKYTRTNSNYKSYGKFLWFCDKCGAVYQFKHDKCVVCGDKNAKITPEYINTEDEYDIYSDYFND